VPSSIKGILNLQILLINLGAALASIIISFAIRALVAVITTKDYFNRQVREAVQLGFTEHQVNIDGVTLNYCEGPHNGPPLLLIPGQGCTWQEYSKALPGLVNFYHIVIVDVPGHGKSAWNPELYNAVTITELMATFIEQQFGGPVLVAGHSSGGLIAGLLAARHPELVSGVLFEDAPFFATEPDRVAKTFVGIDTFANVPGFLSQKEESDWLKWYMPRSYWSRLFGPVWPLFTRVVLKQRNRNPGQPPIVRWLPININRIWETQCNPFDLKFAQTFADNSWFTGFDQAQTLNAIKCPTVFLKATTRFDRQGNLLAALSEEDLNRIESLLPNNETIRVKSSHDIHFAHPKTYQKAVNSLRLSVAAVGPTM